MAPCFITLALCIICFESLLNAAPIQDEDGAARYLHNFGYLESFTPGAYIEFNTISSAIRDYQRFAGLTETGTLNSETIAMMNVPRCGMRDKNRSGRTGRKKRYILGGSRWPMTDLTFHISNFPSSVQNAAKVRHEIVRALKMWSDVSALNFRETSVGQVDIKIQFLRGDHEDGAPFDGPGRTLAHALLPGDGGDVHFDDDEIWKINEKTGHTLIQIAAHEFGHSLGLDHTEEKSAVMAPFFRGYDPRFKLHLDDILGIQQLYGLPSSRAPDLCQDAALDTITRTQDGSTYVFKGNYYWKIDYNVTAFGYPRYIAYDWGGLEGNLDASFTGTDGKTFFFKGGLCWRFTNKAMDRGYPKLIMEEFKGIPDNLDAALAWSENGIPYFFKGDEYWRYEKDKNPPVYYTYPQKISEWKGLPEDGIDAAFVWQNHVSYFFKKDQYYRFDDKASEVTYAYNPQRVSTAQAWFSCPARR